MGFRSLGFRVWGLGFRVSGMGLGFRVWGFKLGFRTQAVLQVLLAGS